MNQMFTGGCLEYSSFAIRKNIFLIFRPVFALAS